MSELRSLENTPAAVLFPEFIFVTQWTHLMLPVKLWNCSQHNYLTATKVRAPDYAKKDSVHYMLSSGIIHSGLVYTHLGIVGM
jgi:hypothetical protein